MVRILWKPRFSILILSAWVTFVLGRDTQTPALNGAWKVTMVLDSAKLLEGKPSGDTVRGRVQFDPSFKTFSMPRSVDTVGAAFGTHDFDFRPFWSGPIPPDYSTSVL